MTSLNTLQSSPPPPKRRKISLDGSDHRSSVIGSAFTIHQCGSSLLGGNLNLTPIVLLPRSRLPLSWLDPSSRSSPSIASGRLFVSNIPALERDWQRGSDPLVLAARAVRPKPGSTIPACLPQNDDDDELYVVERVKRGIYAICGLGRWIGEGDLLVASKHSQKELRDVLPREISSSDAEGDWIERANIGNVFDCEVLGKRQRNVNVSLVFGPKENELTALRDGDPGQPDPSTALLNSPDDLVWKNPKHPDRGENTEFPRSAREGEEAQTARPAETDIPTSGEPTLPSSVQFPLDFIGDLRTQYLEALYVSKSSVAYFAKGPLSRNRAAFQPLDQALVKVSDLSSFYRGSILSVKKMDLKYRTTLPDIIQSLAILSDDETLVRSAPPKKRRIRKLGKDGLYPEEHQFIAKWWRTRIMPESSRLIGPLEEMKRQVADLRLREMQLQTLLILEILSLESSAIKVSSQVPVVEDQSQQPPKKPKGKKPQDLHVALELLVDRLCIWHAVGSEETLPTETSSSREKSESPGQKAENDNIRDFCTEVIIPFYAARLPDQCKAISRKLGVPNAVSPAGPRQSESKKRSRTQPGAAVKRSQPRKSRHTLQRVLTDENPTPPARAPSLLRSTTFSSLPELKRESSEPGPVSLIANARGGIQKPKRIDNREVDLDAVAKQHETKLKKMNMLIQQKKELDAAINALRKPNRELVAKDFADSAHKRLSSNNSRKAKNPVRNPLGQGVQVMATPKVWRKKDCGVVNLPLPPSGWRRSSRNPLGSSPPSSDVQIVPSSIVRPRSICEHEKIDPTCSRVNTVHETPSRPSFRSQNRPDPVVDSEGSVRRDAKRGGKSFNLSVSHTSSGLALSKTNPSSEWKSRVEQSNSTGQAHSSTIQETPPRQTATHTLLEVRVPNLPFSKKGSRSSILTTPPKLHNVVPSPSVDVQTVSLTPEKSIYDHLGWEDDDELALP